MLLQDFPTYGEGDFLWYNGVMVRKVGQKRKIRRLSSGATTGATKSVGVRKSNNTKKTIKTGKLKNTGRLVKRKRKTYGEMYEDYLDGKLKLELYQKVGVVLLVVVFSGFAGWLWEFSLQEIAGGFKHLYIKGGNLLPWINIYAYGAILIIFTTYWMRRYPWAVFVVSALVCGVLEWFAGWIVYTVGNGTRYWAYYDDWWGVGSIDGFVCPASVCAFGVGALLLVYWLVPVCVRMAQKMSRKAFLSIAITLFTMVIVDDITNLTLKNLNLPTAMNLYESWGWKYK